MSDSLSRVCSTAVEHAQMERLVRRQLIPYCYRAIALKPSTAVKSQLESFKQVGRFVDNDSVHTTVI